MTTVEHEMRLLTLNINHIRKTFVLTLDDAWEWIEKYNSECGLLPSMSIDFDIEVSIQPISGKYQINKAGDIYHTLCDYPSKASKEDLLPDLIRLHNLSKDSLKNLWSHIDCRLFNGNKSVSS